MYIINCIYPHKIPFTAGLVWWWEGENGERTIIISPSVPFYVDDQTHYFDVLLKEIDRRTVFGSTLPRLWRSTNQSNMVVELRWHGKDAP